MLWLASFPRSGNTFFRNILHEVYGIPSSTYHLDPDRELDPGYATYPVVKTHLLPGQLPPETRDWPAVYLVRDGRDALVSIAHHRKDIVAPGTDFYNNLLEAILAQNGSFFGGWTENVRQWTDRAAVVIRFADLIADPIREVEKLRGLIDLPPPDPEKLPTFRSLKEGRPAYGGGAADQFDAAKNRRHFRRGKVGAWKDEIPPELLRLLLAIHGPLLRELGFAPAAAPKEKRAKKMILLEASKLFTNDNDGIKRYLTGLDYGLNLLLPHYPHLKVALYYGNGVLVNEADADRADPNFRRLSEREEILQDRRTLPYEKGLLLFKTAVKSLVPQSLYRPLAGYYERGPFRTWLSRLKLSVRKVSGRLSASDLSALVDSADLIHLPLPQHFGELPSGNGRTLVTVHDLTHRLYPDYHDPANVQRTETGMRQALQAKAAFLSVSAATDQDLARLYDVPANRRYVAPEAADPNRFNPRAIHAEREIRRRYRLPDGPYLLTLSTIEPRKNLRRMVEAFIALKAAWPDLAVNLVIGGKMGWKTERIFAGLDLDRPDIVRTGFVEDDHLADLYRYALCLCYASHYEGFGLPIVEAMAVGTPVIYGNNSSQPAVAGAGGIGVDAGDTVSIQAAMHQIITNFDLRDHLSASARSQSHRFSWLKAALLTIDAYEQVLYGHE